MTSRSDGRLIIITPIFGTHSGGASQYYRILIEEILPKTSKFEHVSVVSERIPGRTFIDRQDGVTVYRLFPHRAGANVQVAHRNLRYLAQQFCYLVIPILMLMTRCSTILCHSSFHNQPNVFALVPLCARIFRVRAVIDIRDLLLPKRRQWILPLYHAAIFCSLNVKLRYESAAPRGSRHIPVPMHFSILARQNITTEVCDPPEYGDFLFYAGMIKAEKGIDTLLSAFASLRQKKGFRHTSLILAGPLREHEAWIEALPDGAVYLGEIAFENVLSLITQARLVVNLSHSESLSRLILEAIALRVPVLAPAEIPEFQNICAASICNTGMTPDDIAEKMATLIESRTLCDYSLAAHDSNGLVDAYAEVLQSGGKHSRSAF